MGDSRQPATLRTHAARITRAGATLALLMLAAGCQGQQAGMPNPFMGADRVPAPSTRVPMQGTAQPYYPTGALPPLQGGQPAGGGWGAPNAASDITPIPGGANFSSSSNVPNAQSYTASADRSSLGGSEPGIAIPTDHSDIRFAQAPPAVLSSPPAAGVAAAVPHTTQQLPPAPTPTNPAPALASQPYSLGPNVTLTPVDNDGSHNGLFREPTTPSATAPPAINPAVLTPHLPEGATTPGGTPRIRLPQSQSYHQQPLGESNAVSMMSYQVALEDGTIASAGGLPAGGVAMPGPQPMAPQYSQLAPQSAPQSQVPVASDGFRPRGSTPPRETNATSTSQPTSTLPATQEVYSIGPGYQSLSGMLEISPATGGWQIRYLPVGGAADQFGGRLEVMNGEVLAGRQPGQVVTLQGQLVASPHGPSFPPQYAVYTVH